jgi:hypothetical protein
MSYRLRYGAFVIEDAQIELLPGSQARLLDHDGGKVSLGPVFDDKQAPVRPGLLPPPVIAVKPGASADEWEIVDPYAPTNRFLFTFPLATATFLAGAPNARYGVRLRSLDGKFISLGRFTARLRAVRDAAGTSEQRSEELEKFTITAAVGAAATDGTEIEGSADVVDVPELSASPVTIPMASLIPMRPEKDGWSVDFTFKTPFSNDQKFICANKMNELYLVNDEILVAHLTRIGLRLSIRPETTFDGTPLPEVLIRTVPKGRPKADRTSRITDFLVKNTNTTESLLAPLTRLLIHSDGIDANWVNGAVWDHVQNGSATGGAASPLLLEHLHHYRQESLESDGSSGAIEYSVRPYRGTVTIRNADQSAGPEPAGTVTALPPKAGEFAVAYEGEIQPRALPDATNDAIRLFGNVQVRKLNESGTSRGYAMGKGMREYRDWRGRVSGEGAGPTPAADSALTLGDLRLMLHDRAAGDAGNPAHVDFYTRHIDPNKRGNWQFAVKEIAKTPFKGASVPELTWASAPVDSIPRTERYRPDGNSHLILPFDSDAQFLGQGDFANPFNILETVTPLAEPHNSHLAFKPGTKFERITNSATPSGIAGRVRALAGAGNTLMNDADAFYTSIDVELRFPQLPGSGETPTVRWNEPNPPQKVPNNKVRTQWTQSDARYSKFRVDQKTYDTKPGIPLPFGWIAELPDQPVYDPVLGQPMNPVVIFEAASALQDHDPDPTPLEFEVEQNQVVRMRPRIPAGGPWIAVDPDWRQLFPLPHDPAQGTRVASPLDPYWRGTMVLHGLLHGPDLLPKPMKDLLNKLPIHAWWDGNGVSAVCDFKVDLTDSNSNKETYIVYKDASVERVPVSKIYSDEKIQLVLGRTFVLISQNQVQKIDLKFWWNIPFFDRDKQSGKYKPQWVEIRGRWSKGQNGQGDELVLNATLPDRGIDVGWMGIRRVEVSNIVIKRTSKPGDEPKWSIAIDGSVEFESDSLLSEWFDSRLKSLSFQGLSFGFENPLKDWKFPELKLNTNIALLPKGFDFSLRGFGLANPTQTNLRRLNLFGALRIGIPYLNFLPGGATVDVVLAFEWDPANPGEFGLRFDMEGVREIEFKIFNFLRLKGALEWNRDQKTKDKFAASMTVDWGWSDNDRGKGIAAGFTYGSTEPNSSKKFWVAGVEGGTEAGKTFDLGILTAEEVWLIAGYHATLPPGGAGKPSLRELVTEVQYDGMRDALQHRMGDWEYTDASNWFAGLHFSKLTLKGLGDAIRGKDVTLFLSDDGLFRGRFTIEPMGVPLKGVELAIDWRHFAIGGSIGMPNLNYGAYRVDLGEVGFFLGQTDAGIKVSFDWGFPYNLNWSRAIKVHWEPPPWPIPINEVQGGVMISCERTIGRFGVMTGVAVRAGYTFLLGSDGGSFGAYISGSIFLGAIVTTTILVPDPTQHTKLPAAIIQTGLVTFDVQAAGGVIVFGFKWDIIKVWVHADAGFVLTISGRGMSASFGARFEAGFKVCLTPCTCIGGSISFRYGFDAHSEGTQYQWPPPPDGAGAPLPAVAGALIQQEQAPIEDIMLTTLRDIHAPAQSGLEGPASFKQLEVQSGAAREF